jgi:hypothetical protein
LNWGAVIILGAAGLAAFILFLTNIADPQAVVLTMVSGVVTSLCVTVLVVLFVFRRAH